MTILYDYMTIMVIIIAHPAAKKSGFSGSLCPVQSILHSLGHIVDAYGLLSLNSYTLSACSVSITEASLLPPRSARSGRTKNRSCELHFTGPSRIRAHSEFTVLHRVTVHSLVNSAQERVPFSRRGHNLALAPRPHVCPLDGMQKT